MFLLRFLSSVSTAPVCRFAVFMLCWAAAGGASAQEWFDSSAVSCSLSNADVNLGVFSRISNPVPPATGDFGVACSSTAYPGGFPTNYHTVEAAYCVTIGGKQDSRVLSGTGKNADVTIPFDFYFARQKAFSPGGKFQQDYNTPIGDGTWGIPYIDWNYMDGNPRRPRPPSTIGPPYTLPARGKFDLHLNPSVNGKVYPAGIYTAHFPFFWIAGATKTTGQYSSPSVGSGCSGWRGSRGSGTITVRLEIKKYCYVKTNRNIDFGAHVLLNESLQQRGEIEADCSAGTQFGVGINDGVNSAFANGGRAMRRKGADDVIRYDLYKDSSLTQRWGNDWGSDSSVQRGVGSGAGQVFPVWASVPPQGGKPPGIYQDQLVVEIKILDPGGP